MARTVTIAERNFGVGTITRTLDSFPADVRHIRVRLTRVNWPGANSDNVARIAVDWNDGTGASFELPGGQVMTRSGQVMAYSEILITVPEERDPTSQDPLASRRRAVTSGVVTFDVRQALRTAITAEAV